ncbi:hypothetical protein [Candidatus Uabimicrobium amorphum]|uniref:C2 domain-containing protein n=1 Tax=Uabimicrobium amorphum TaxID=2596890 RepID=A0A5S9IJ83_UABAM|nr:hypothetical protein [Candidatus Uabimicrobium amorphum]BBM82456.1 hypothetical protein UABAM_00799 [Candidatus Uabimicrobium amorphum]
MRFFVIIILSVFVYANDTQWVTKDFAHFSFKVQASWKNSSANMYQINNSNYVDFRHYPVTSNIEEEIAKIENILFAQQVYSKVQQKSHMVNHASGTAITYKTATQFYDVFFCIFEDKLYVVLYCFSDKLYAQMLQNSAQSFTVKKVNPSTVEEYHKNFAVKYSIDPKWQKEVLTNTVDKKTIFYRISPFFSMQVYMEILPFEVPLHLTIEKIQRIFFPHHVYARVIKKPQTSVPGKQYFYIIRDKSFPLRYRYAEIFFCIRGRRAYAVAYFYQKKSVHLEDILKSLVIENKFSYTDRKQDTTTETNDNNPDENSEPSETEKPREEDVPKITKSYLIHVTSAKIFIQKTNGKKWDFGWGKTTAPDSYATIKEFGSEKEYTTSIVRNSLQPKWNYATPIVAKKGQVLVINVYDDDSRKNDEIGTIMITIKESDIKKGFRDIQFNSVEKLTLTFMAK